MHLRENEHSTFEAQAIQKDQETANRMMKDKRRTAERKKSLCFTTRSRTSAPQLHNELNYVLCVRIGRSFYNIFIPLFLFVLGARKDQVASAGGH